MTADQTASLMRPKCPNCGYIGVPGARFCSNCGTRLDSADFKDATGVMPEGAPESGSLPRVGDRPSSGAVLLVVKGANEGARYSLDADIVTIGRDAASDVFLDDITVSRNHAEVLHGATGWQLRDKGSYNGIYVNRKRVDGARLNHGDEVQIGLFRFLFLAAAQ